MPQLKSDVVEVFVVCCATVQSSTLLGKRKSQQPFGSIWQPFSARIDIGEPTDRGGEALTVSQDGMADLRTGSASDLNRTSFSIISAT